MSGRPVDDGRAAAETAVDQMLAEHRSNIHQHGQWQAETMLMTRLALAASIEPDGDDLIWPFVVLMTRFCEATE